MPLWMLRTVRPWLRARWEELGDQSPTPQAPLCTPHCSTKTLIFRKTASWEEQERGRRYGRTSLSHTGQACNTQLSFGSVCSPCSGASRRCAGRVGEGVHRLEPLENARSSFHLKVLNLISSAKSLWSCKVTNSKFWGIRTGTSLGVGLVTVVRPDWLNLPFCLNQCFFAWIQDCQVSTT